MTSRDVNIKISAKNEATRALEEAGRSMDRLRQKAAALKQQERDTGGGFGDIAKFTKVVGAVNAIGGAFTAVNALAATFAGDSEKALKAIERLPFGLGETAKRFREILEPLFGITERLEAINKIQAQTSKMQADLRKATTAEAGNEEQLRRERQQAKLIAANPGLGTALVQRDIAVENARVEFERASKDKNSGSLITLRELRDQRIANAEAELARFQMERDQQLNEQNNRLVTQRMREDEDAAAERKREAEKAAAAAERETAKSERAGRDGGIASSTTRLDGPIGFAAGTDIRLERGLSAAHANRLAQDPNAIRDRQVQETHTKLLERTTRAVEDLARGQDDTTTVELL